MGTTRSTCDSKLLTAQTNLLQIHAVHCFGRVLNQQFERCLGIRLLGLLVPVVLACDCSLFAANELTRGEDIDCSMFVREPGDRLSAA